ncbi:MAG: hypothetical protein ACLSAH_08685 [Bilophila wadsworthia]
MEKAAALEARDLRPLVLVIGGFLDRILGTATPSAPAIPPISAPDTTSGSASYESRKMRDIVNIYASKAIPWLLSGTAGAGTRRSTSSPASSAPVDLISLDPYRARERPPENPQRPPLAEHHIDYSRAPARHPNLVPIGGRGKPRKTPT